MTGTFAALLFGHVLADFVFQTGWMVRRKRHPGVLLLHGLIVLATAALATGRVDAWPLAALALAHMAIDAAKGWLAPEGLAAFLADQAAHLATLAAVAVAFPGLWAGGFWAGLDWLPAAMTLLAGAILATRAGSFAVGFLIAPWGEMDLPQGLPSAGRLIGLLERGLIFLFILAGHPAGIGFLIAAKSVLRFDTASRDQRAGEYVIVGTLASFGWAIAVSYATTALLAALPPLGFPPPGP